MPHLKEDKFSTLVVPWLEINLFPKLKIATAIEYKKVDGGTFNIKAWKSGKQGHQYTNLANAKTDVGVYYKIPDTSTDTKPFDAYIIKNAEETFLIVWFNKFQKFAVIPQSDIDSYGKSVSYKQLDLHKLIKREKVVVEAW